MKLRRFLRFHKFLHNSGFTLIELLVVIAIIAILAVVVVLTLNPAELLRQSRDANRLSDLATLTSAVNLYNTDQGGASSYSLGSASTTYISVPDPTAPTSTGNNCSGIGMPTSTTYHCSASSIYRNITSYGWLPVNFSKITAGSPMGALPVDPTNQTSSGLYYSYATNGTTFEFSATPESQKDIALEEANPNMFIAGSNTNLLTAGGIANGSVSQANMKLSIASNTAFVDFNSVGTLTPYIGDELIVRDSSGNALVGYIKAAGTGQTYGSQLLNNTTFATTTGLTAFGSTIAAITSGCYSSNCLQITYTTQGQVWNPFTVAEGALLRASVYGNLGTANYLAMKVEEAGGSYEFLNAVYYNSGWSSGTIYATTDLTGTSWWQTYQLGFSTSTSYVDTASVQQVLTPSVMGVTIVSALGGSTYNWTSEQSGFNRNDSNGYTYSIVI